MNQEWSNLHKQMQTQFKKKDSYEAGINTLIDLRTQLMNTLLLFQDELHREDFDAIPFINAKGYHSKTIAYSIWHIFRIEDIVAHSLLSDKTQIFFADNYQERIHSSIITTGNELVKQQIADFSKNLNLNELYSYSSKVKDSTDRIIRDLSFDEMKRKFPGSKKEYLQSLDVVSTNEQAVWLIDYWCNKDIRGLIHMPFSRHWIMHIEACLRIKNKIQP
jgi:hypothetical protein